MPNFNKVIIAGHLTRDIELRHSASGLAIGNTAIATTRKSGKEGSSKDETLFIDLTVFDKKAETLAQFCKKGSPLLVEGRLVLDQWEDKTTKEKRSKIKMVVETFQFLASGEKTEKATSKVEEEDPFA